jgi:hypothetical protein
MQHGDTYQVDIKWLLLATGINYDIAAGSLAAGTYTLGVYGRVVVVHHT